MAFLEAKPELLAAAVAAISAAPLLAALALQLRAKNHRQRVAAVPLDSEHQWGVLRSSELIPAKSLEELVVWATEGRVFASDDIYNPNTRRWSIAITYPVIAESIRKRFDLTRKERTGPIEVGCMILAAMIVVAVIVILSWDRTPPSSTPQTNRVAEMELEESFRDHLRIDAPIEITREGIANSVTIYTRKTDFQEIPFPNRPAVLRSVASSWCKTQGIGWLTSIRVRDIRTGEQLAGIHCER